MNKAGSVIGVISILILGANLSRLKGQTPKPKPSVEEQLRSQYHAASVDEKGVVQPGTAVVVRQAGITVLPAPKEWPCNAYKQGDHIKQTTMCAVNYSSTRNVARHLLLGGKVNITAIQFKPSELVLHVQTEDGIFKGAVSFLFPKDYLDSMNVKQIQDTVSEIFVPAAKNPAKGPTDQATLARIVGQYGMAQSPDDRLQLNSDGTFSLSQAGRNFSGPFTIDGDSVTLQMGNGASKGVLQGDSIIDPNGSTWVKKGAGTAATPTTPSSPGLRLPSSYVSASTSADQLQLNADHSFSLQEAGQPYRGTFVANGNTLEIKISDGPTTTMTLDGNNLKDASGQAWVRQEQTMQPAPSAGVLHNQDIINLAKAGIDDAITIAKIGSSKCQFETSTGDLIQLKQAGVSADVLKAMVGVSK